MPQLSLLHQSSPELCVYLRRRTEAAHRSLEARLDLMTVPSLEKWTALLQRFHGFHAAWEPALRRWPLVATFMAPRSRLTQLHADLTRLGCSEQDIACIPLCVQAAGLPWSAAAALGSVYVLEGSTLGGQLITRALAGAAWAPEGGLAYFNPYGAATGRMWRDFKAWADGMLAQAEHDAAADAAEHTFAILEQWLSS